MAFKISRLSGKSDSEVLVDALRDRKPGELIEYSELEQILGADSERVYNLRSVQSSVCRAERQIAVNLSRALINVPKKGYCIAPAADHQKVAGRKKDRAENLIKRGLTQLRHVRWDEMDENQRAAHEGQLLVTAGLHAAMVGIDARLSKIEKAIRARESD